MIVTVTADHYEQYEAFVKTHPNGGFTQSLKWRDAKKGWESRAFLSLSEDGTVRGSMLVLIRRLPLGYSFVYVPRGPVCDLNDRKTAVELLDALKALGKAEKAYRITVDPTVRMDDAAAVQTLTDYGFSQDLGGDSGLKTIQARFNYQLDITDKTPDELIMQFHSKTRYNIRVATKHNVEVRVCGEEALPDFARLMATTGERDGFATRPQGYFKTFLDALGDDARLYVCYYDGKAVSGAISTFYGNKACYVYGASDNAHRNVMPNYLMQWAMIQYAIERGCTLYDFQGVSGNITDEHDPQYGLYRFKKGFNGELVEYAGEFSLIQKPFIDRVITLADTLRRKFRRT